MKKSIFILVTLLYYSANLYSQLEFKDITLVKSFQKKSDKTEPSIFSFTIPKNKKNSYLINSAIGFDLLNAFLDKYEKEVTLIPNFEFNRNTLIDKEQHQFLFGLSSEIPFTIKKFIPVNQIGVKYSNDVFNKIESIQYTFDFYPIITGVDENIRNFFYPDNLVYASRAIGFEYIPSIGIEGDSRYKAKKDSLEGGILRFVPKVESSIYLFPKYVEGEYQFHYFQLKATYSYRMEIINNTDDSLENNNLLNLSLNYTIHKNDDIDAKIAIEYVKGQNPMKGLEDQEYYNLVVKIKL